MRLTKISRQQRSISNVENLNSSTVPLEHVFYKSVIESLWDGLLILNEQGDWIESNDIARRICTQLTANQSHPTLVPQEIWHICQSLLESSSLYSQQPVIIESEIRTNKSKALRIRVQRFKFSEIDYSCLLVILEDRSQTLHNLAISEVDKYGLTSREAEVWLLSRTNYTRQEIAAELCISLNTVKKHLKNIHAKRKTVFYMKDYSSELPYDWKQH